MANVRKTLVRLPSGQKISSNQKEKLTFSFTVKEGFVSEDETFFEISVFVGSKKFV